MSSALTWWWRRVVVVWVVEGEEEDEAELRVLRREVRLERRREIWFDMAARSGARGRGGGFEGGMVGWFVDRLID
jgi:hypothetical protein